MHVKQYQFWFIGTANLGAWD